MNWTEALEEIRVAELEQLCREQTLVQTELRRKAEIDEPFGGCTHDIVDAATSSTSKKKCIGSYVRVGVDFKVRKNSRYVESDSDEKHDCVSDSI
ncbi:hypothetical protein LIER_12553 [Lithospermum erythrorhizon]|uniref:Uncharacterized protein n=1 Tax=Lithospermum erythrorhizon TaxID=34254 RepID=A0AAV3PUL4_LITER